MGWRMTHNLQEQTREERERPWDQEMGVEAFLVSSALWGSSQVVGITDAIDRVNCLSILRSPSFFINKASPPSLFAA